MPSIYVRSSLLSPVRHLDILSSFISISSQLIYMTAWPYFKATSALQLGLESITCSSLVFPSWSQPWLGRPLPTINSFELCYSTSPSRNEFPISFDVCSASIPTPTPMLISVCHQALESWRCLRLTKSAPEDRWTTSPSGQCQIAGCHAVLHLDLNFQNVYLKDFFFLQPNT